MNTFLKYRDQVLNEIAKKDGYDLESIDDLYSLLDNLNTELNSLQDEQTKFKSLLSSVPTNKSFFYKLFHKKKYLQNIEDRREFTHKLSDIESSIKRIEEEIDLTETDIQDITYYKEDLSKKLTNQHVVKHIQTNNPEMFKSVEFMKDCISVDLEYILLDQTESDELYLTFLNQFKKKFLSECKDESILKAFDEIVLEIKNPSPVDSTKYKIPYKYLIQNLLLGKNDNNGLYYIVTTIFSYKKYNGLFEYNYGKKLEYLFDDPNNYLYLHNIVYRAQKLPPEKIKEIVDSICKNGLKLTTAGNEIGKIDYTTLNTHASTDRSFFSYLPYWQLGEAIVILQIPKDIIDNNMPVLGNYSEKLTHNDPGYVLPKYVSGFISHGDIHPNKIPEAEQTKYPYILPENVNTNTDIFSF